MKKRNHWASVGRDDCHSKMHFDKIFFSNFSFLCANFANTMAIKDRMGRTPFHYSAICNDGGQYYDLLKQHGADSSIVDSVIKHFGHKS
jgi:ankyrin repeat protein